MKNSIKFLIAFISLISLSCTNDVQDTGAIISDSSLKLITPTSSFNLILDGAKLANLATTFVWNDPANPNGSDYNTAMLCDTTGRHLVMMPHIERSTFQWNWAHYPKDRNDEVSPWHEAFVNARLWIEKI